MSSLRQPERYTLEEYFALERASERRFEYRDGDIVCMSGGSVAHAAIARNILSQLTVKLRGSSCRVYGSDLAVYVPAGRPYRYPDASVVCGDTQVEKVDGRDCLANPALLVEVLSPTSADYDRGTKFEEYKSIPTLTDYLLVAQDRAHVVLRTRRAPATWSETTFDSLDATIPLASISQNISMRELYEGLALA
jgi:Uma2 family endonuclease